MIPLLALVIPCYNEEEVLPETAQRLKGLFLEMISEQIIADKSYVLFVNDGSQDQTWQLIENLNKENPLFKGLKLTRNFGHQNALLAGLYNVEDADVIISVDADLQDDLNAIKTMIDKYSKGYDIVYGVREDRTSDSFMKRNTALYFYKLLKLMGVESVYNHADYRLMSKKAMNSFKDFEEVNLFLRGMIPLIGYKSTSVHYDRQERFAGSSKYNYRKMLSFAWDGITSLSFKPLHFVTFIGFTVFFVTLILSLISVIAYFKFKTTPGWTSIVLPMYFLGGIQLLCIGLIGEYIGKIYKEVKQRPRFLIEDHLK